MCDSVDWLRRRCSELLLLGELSLYSERLLLAELVEFLREELVPPTDSRVADWMSGESLNNPGGKMSMSFSWTRNVRARSWKSSEFAANWTTGGHHVNDGVALRRGGGESLVGCGGSELRASSHT